MSFFTNRKPVIKLIKQLISSERLEELKILDLGIGYGNFGKLIKKNIKITIRMIGVEIWEKYKTKKWERYYDNVLIQDIKVYTNNCNEKFDVVLLIDVLEHLDKKEGFELMKNCMNITRKLFIVSSPATDYPQGAVFGNPYEKHRHIWSEKEMNSLGFKTFHKSKIPTFSIKPLFSDLCVYVFKK